MNSQSICAKRAVIRFRQFAHRSYSAFASLHHEVTIGRVSARICNLEMLKAGHTMVLPIALMLAEPVAATESTDSLTAEEFAQQLKLQEVLVTSEKAEVQSQTYRLVRQVSADEIAALPITTVADILRYLPGVDVRARGANGSQTDVTMRGGTFDQVLVMLNGVNLTDAHTGHYSMNLPIPASMIERIEVLEGTSANLFGLNAFAGAINIVTQSNKREAINSKAINSKAITSETINVETQFQLSAGMYGYVHPELGIRTKKGDWYLNSAVEYSRANGYDAPNAAEKEKEALANTDYKIANIYLQTGYKGLDIQLGAQYKDAGAGMFYGSSTDQFDATRTAFGSAGYSHRWGAWSLDAQASYRANYDRYEWHRGQRLYGNFHFTQNAAASLKGHYASQIGRTTVGLEVRNENIHSTNLGDTINPNGQVPNVDGFDLKDLRVLDLVRGKNRLNVNYFAEQTFIWQDLSASLGVSGNWNTMFGNNIAGGANIGYRYAKTGTVYVNANRSLRLPTFTDLYYKAGQQRGNRDLNPEKAWMLGIGTKYSKGFGEMVNGQWSNGQLSAAADWYYRWGRDIIDWVWNESDELYHAQNWNRVNATGLELGLDYTLNDWLRHVRVQYAYTWLDIDMSKTVSSYLDYLSHKVIVGVDHGIWNGTVGGKRLVVGANWTMRWQKREGQFKNVAGETESYKPVLLLDGSVYAERECVRISADCTNMTNRHYYDYGGILQPGAWVKGTIAVRL